MSRWSRNHSAFLLVAGLALLGVTGCRRHAPDPADGILRISQRNEPATLDPQLATLPDEFFVIRALSEGLVTPSPVGGTPLPGIVSHWEATDNWSTWTFHMNPGAQWSDGTPVTPADFIYSIRRALTPAFGAPKAALFFAIRNAAAFYHGQLTDFSQVGLASPDDRTLVITLEHPMPDFLQLAASGPWIAVQRAVVERLGAAWTKPGNFVGNGPFTLAGWSPNQRITVRRNPRYYHSFRVRLAGIQFLAFDNGDTEERAFRAGQVDVTMAVPANKLAGYRGEELSPLHDASLHETRYLVLNTTRPPLDDVRVRRALALALNRGALTANVLQGGQSPAFTFVPPGLGGYEPDAKLAENTAEARRLLAEAGFPDGRGFPKLELTSWPVNPAQLEAIQQMWRNGLGIEITLAPREARAHLAALAAGDYAVAFMTAIPDYDSAADLFIRLTAGNPDNYARWRNAEYDRLVTQAGQLADPAARNAAYRSAEKVLLDEMPVIPLYFNAQTYLVQPAVQGWQADRLWTRYYTDLSL